MDRCQCLTLEGKQCSRNAKSNGFCTQHANCTRPMGTTFTQTVIEEGSPQKRPMSATTKNVLDTYQKRGPKTAEEKRRMLANCGEKCCATTKGDQCSYALCSVDTCDEDCDVIYGSAVLSRMHKPEARVAERVTDAFDRNRCSRRGGQRSP